MNKNTTAKAKSFMFIGITAQELELELAKISSLYTIDYKHVKLMDSIGTDNEPLYNVYLTVK